jgi:hypothetical protein
MASSFIRQLADNFTYDMCKFDTPVNFGLFSY